MFVVGADPSFVRRFALLLGLVACQSGLETSSTEQEIIILSPTSYDFGPAQIGMQTGAFSVSVNPSAGANSNTVTSVTASCPDFIISAQGLPADVYRTCLVGCPGGPLQCPAPPPVCNTDEYVTYQFDTYFKPTVAGAVSCVVTVHANTGDRTMTLMGTGQQPPVDIDVSPTAVAFGDVRRNTDSTAVAMTVRNLGGAVMTVSAASVSSGYTMTGPAAPYNVNPGGSTGYQLKCHPTATGAMPGTFSITSNDPATPTVNISLTCNGIDSNIDIAPSPAVLATTRVGEPVMKTITLTNMGAAASTLESVAVTGGVTMVSGPPPGTMLAANGGTAQVMVSFDASAAGPANSSLDVSYDGGMVRTSQISAMALSTSMSLTPDGDVDFGPVCIGQTKQQSFAIIANDQGSFKIDQMVAPADPFTIVPPTLPASVQGSGANTVMFTINAAPIAEGDATGVVEVDTDIPLAAPRMINLDVVGLAAGVTPTPLELDLGSNPIQMTTIGQPIKLSNCSAAPVGWSNARITGADATEFAIVAQPETPTIPATSFASWLVVLSAHTTGVKQAMFEVDYDGGTAMVPLDGEGLGAGGGAGDKSSYYACSTGGPTSVWPIALVVTFVVRRRRRA